MTTQTNKCKECGCDCHCGIEGEALECSQCLHKTTISDREVFCQKCDCENSQ